MVGFAVVVVAPLAVLWLAIASVDRASPEYLGRCDPGSASLLSAAGGLIWATIDLLLIYAVVVWFIERRRGSKRTVRQAGRCSSKWARCSLPSYACSDM